MTILFAFGMPGVMSSWGFAALQAVARQAFGDYTAIATDRIDDLKQYRREKPKAHVVLTSQFPEAALCDHVLREKCRFALFLDDPFDAVSYLARCSDQQDFAIIRAVSGSTACLESLLDSPHALVIRRDGGDLPDGIDELTGMLARHFGIDLTAEAMSQTLLHLGMKPSLSETKVAAPGFEEAAAAIIAGYVPPQGGGRELDARFRETAAKVLRPLDIGQSDTPDWAVSWPRETFFLGDRPGEKLDGAIDLTGRARCLIYGPYFHLSRGHWDARLQFGIDEDTHGQTFTVEIHAKELLGRQRVKPLGIGNFETVIPFDVMEPQASIEIRLLMDSGAIEGCISGWSVDLLPTTEAWP